MYVMFQRRWKPSRVRMRIRTKCMGIVVACSLFIMCGLSWYANSIPHFILETIMRQDVGRIISKETSRAFADMTMTERKQFVNDRCKEVRTWHENDEPVEVKAIILFDKSNKLLACINLKVGSRSIIKTLRSISNERKLVDRHLWLHMKKNASTKAFMFVREPLRRLLSAYSLTKGIRMVSASAWATVTFATFLEEIIQIDDYNRINPHYLSYYRACRPCDFEYDFIGTVDTLREDLSYIMQRLNVDLGDVSHIGARNVSATEDDAVINSLPVHIRQGIWKMYKEDYTLFGYPKPF